jgi:hypothetical protein
MGEFQSGVWLITLANLRSVVEEIRIEMGIDGG